MGWFPTRNLIRTAAQSFTFRRRVAVHRRPPERAGDYLGSYHQRETLDAENKLVRRDNGVASVRVTVANSLAAEPRSIAETEGGWVTAACAYDCVAGGRPSVHERAGGGDGSDTQPGCPFRVEGGGL